MRYFIPVLLVIALASCYQSAPKFTPKTDSAVVSYKDSSQGPALYVGLYHVDQSFIPVSAGSTFGKYVPDTAWLIKQRTDTLTDPKANHTYRYIPVPKIFVTIVPGDPTKY